MGFVSGGSSKQGWMVRRWHRYSLFVLVFLIQYLGYNAAFTLQQYLFHGGFIITAIIGGIFGGKYRTKLKNGFNLIKNAEGLSYKVLSAFLFTYVLF
ncbi:hypothetical protein KHA80_04655 [Anaerobacillus sp. HL2]|nr:hypothetical protein KHA80_04655 [Anaerobacillus sp. HL2]